jgi:hypothetical protein
LLFAGFPSPVERGENSLLVFEFSTLSTGRHFHGAFRLGVFGAQRRGPGARRRRASPLLRQPFFLLGPNRTLPHQKLAPGSSRNNDLTALDPRAISLR